MRILSHPQTTLASRQHRARQSAVATKSVKAEFEKVWTSISRLNEEVRRLKAQLHGS
jgi:hypothetical protein